MSNVKEKVIEVVRSQPDDAIYEEIIRVVFERMVDRGMEDSRAGRLISNEDMERWIRAGSEAFKRSE